MNTVNKKISANNELFAIFLSVISFFYFILEQYFIPPRFRFDSGEIRNAMMDPLSVDESYRSTATFFKNIGFKPTTPSILLVLFFWIIFIFLLFTVVKVNKYREFSIAQIILLTFFMLMYGFYFTDYSKDVIVLLFLSIAMVLPIIHKNILINIVLAIFIYGYFFRDYWLVIGTISLIPLFIKNIRIKRDIFYIFLAIVLFIFIYHITQHTGISNLRTHVNLTRINNPNARSVINNLISGDSIYDDIINYIYVLISLFIPAQGIPSFNVIIYYLWIISLVIFAIKHKNVINLRILLVLFVFINIQALFEPDFGSVFRHQLAWFPVINTMLISRTTKSIGVKA